MSFITKLSVRNHRDTHQTVAVHWSIIPKSIHLPVKYLSTTNESITLPHYPINWHSRRIQLHRQRRPVHDEGGDKAGAICTRWLRYALITVVTTIQSIMVPYSLWQLIDTTVPQLWRRWRPVSLRLPSYTCQCFRMRANQCEYSNPTNQYYRTTLPYPGWRRWRRVSPHRPSTPSTARRHRSAPVPAGWLQ